MATADDEFGGIDWNEHEPRRFPVGRRTAGFVLSLVALAAAFAYDYAVVPDGDPLVLAWDLTVLDWLFLGALSTVAVYLAVPLWTNRRLTGRYWRRLRGNLLAVASLAFLVVLFLVGLFGPVVLDYLRQHFGITAGHAYANTINPNQPPIGFSVVPEKVTPLGSVDRVEEFCTGEVADGRCHGSILHPLGTTPHGRSVLTLVVAGARVAVQIAVITAAIAIPLAIAVGTLAAEASGLLDRALTSTIDFVEALPPFFVYLFVVVFYTRGLLLVVLVFGLLGWGGMARLVRSEALQKLNEEYVLAARSAGASRFAVVRRHVVPNVSNTVVTATTLYVPTVIIVEATLAYLGLDSTEFAPGSGINRHQASWGTAINFGIEQFPGKWWPVVVPGLALLLTVLAFNLLGETVRARCNMP